MTTPELWLPVPGHEKYIVSELGRVARLLRPARNSKGYMKVTLPGRTQVYVHQLVLRAFAGPAPAGHTADHYDFNRGNNALTNLRWLPKPLNDWRWQVNEADVDPVELARVEAAYAELEAADAVPSWLDEQEAAS